MRKDNFILGIDASNIGSGGAEVHLKNVVHEMLQLRRDIRIVIWSKRELAERLSFPKCVIVHSSWWLEGKWFRFLGVQLLLPIEFLNAKCDWLLSPGGTVPFLLARRATVISQNLLPFEMNVVKGLGSVAIFIKMLLLFIVQALSFKCSAGVVFLSDYARKKILLKVGRLSYTRIIPHGIETSFKPLFEDQLTRQKFESSSKTKELLFVSPTLTYKHHIELISAVSLLDKEGYSVRLTLVGDNDNSYGMEVKRKLLGTHFNHCAVDLVGHADRDDIIGFYKRAEFFVFPSSCENLPITVLEAMAVGLPVLAYENGVVPTLIERNGANVFFPTLSALSIAEGLKLAMACSKNVLAQTARANAKAAMRYDWTSCADETLQFCMNLHKKAR